MEGSPSLPLPETDMIPFGIERFFDKIGILPSVERLPMQQAQQ